MSFKAEGRKAVNHLERHNIILFDSEQRNSQIRSKHYRYPQRENHHQDKADVGNTKNLYPNQDYDHLVAKHKASKTQFSDNHFPASNSLLTPAMQGSRIEWLRPRDICKKMGKSPEMVVNKRNRFDINQGEVGDCWFLAALAQLAEKERCFNRVVPVGQGFGVDYVGIFRFRFFRFGGWVEVVIDDKLPTRNGQLVFLKAGDSNEFWSPLLEKAYAKLYGSYQALDGGLSIEAAVDFTGGIPEVLNLSDKSKKDTDIFTEMLETYESGGFLSCSLSNSSYQIQADGLRKGLQARHAYSITKVVKIPTRKSTTVIPLIRLRNPHGNSKEWTGEWSDGHFKWNLISSDVKKKHNLIKDSDGEFYMNFDRDFLKYFGELELVHLTPGSMGEEKSSEKYDVFPFQGKWTGSTAGGCGNDAISSFARNPQLIFTLTDPDQEDDSEKCSVIISLAQRPLAGGHQNVVERKSEYSIGFRVYKVPKGKDKLASEDFRYTPPAEKTNQYINLREVTKRMHLPPGKYSIMPSTFNRGEEGDFFVRVFVEKNWGSSKQARRRTVKSGMEYFPRDSADEQDLLR